MTRRPVITVIGKSGHFPQITEPAVVADAIRSIVPTAGR